LRFFLNFRRDWILFFDRTMVTHDRSTLQFLGLKRCNFFRICRFSLKNPFLISTLIWSHTSVRRDKLYQFVIVLIVFNEYIYTIYLLSIRSISFVVSHYSIVPLRMFVFDNHKHPILVHSTSMEDATHILQHAHLSS
jgi:hypothetical protein